MKRLFIFSIVIVVSFFTWINAVQAQDRTLTVYAAASMTGPLKKIAQAFESDLGVKVKMNFASSGHLARQLTQGAPADVFISASQKWMKHVVAQGLVLAETRINPIANSVVLIAPVDFESSKITFDAAFPFSQSFKGKFAMGDYFHVPAGRYAKEAMESLGWWEEIRTRTIKAKDVRQALMIVEAQEVELGTVYASDAKKSEKVKIVGKFPAYLHAPVIYSAVVCLQGQSKQLGRKFLNFLTQEKAQQLFFEYGFVDAVDIQKRLDVEER